MSTNGARPLPGAQVVEVDVGEAAARIRRSARTVRRWCASGYLRARKYPSPRMRRAEWLIELDPRTGRPAVGA